MAAASDPRDVTIDQIWADLAAGAATHGSAYRTPTLASIGLDGRPQARTVVLRRVDGPHASLVFYTDRRSPKVGQLSAQPLMAWLFWDTVSRTQLRIDAIATAIHVDDDVADAAWARLTEGSRRDYQSAGAPSDAISTAAQEGFALDQGRSNFAVIVSRVQRIDWLRLDAQGNHRLEFTLDEAGGVSVRRLVP